MANHSSVLAGRIPGTAEPGGLLSMGLHRIGHDWNNLAAAAVHAIRNRIVLRTQVSQQKSQPFFLSIHFFEDQLAFLRSWGCEHVDSSLLVSISKINIISIYEQFKKINFQV